MKTITLTDEQFDNLFNYLDEKVNFIVNKSIDYQAVSYTHLRAHET